MSRLSFFSSRSLKTREEKPEYFAPWSVLQVQYKTLDNNSNNNFYTHISSIGLSLFMATTSWSWTDRLEKCLPVCWHLWICICFDVCFLLVQSELRSKFAPYVTYIQAFLDFCGFDFRNFRFNKVHNSTLFSSPLVTSVSKKLGQSTIGIHYSALSQFFWNRRYMFIFEKWNNFDFF